jgi:hypothetical protein
MVKLHLVGLGQPGTEGRGGGVGRSGGHRNTAIQPELVRGRGLQVTAQRAGVWQQRRQSRRVESQRGDHIEIPGVTLDVVQQGGGCVAGFGIAAASYRRSGRSTSTMRTT